MNAPLQACHFDLPMSLLARGAEVRLDEEWARVEVASPARDPESLLRSASAFPSRLRIAIAADGSPRLSADFIFGVDQAAEVGEVFAALEEGGGASVAGSDASAPEPGADELSRLCREAGYEFHPRRSGGGCVSLDAPPAVPPARLLPLNGGLRLIAEMPVADALSAPSREAIAWLLLDTAGAVRLVRPAFGEGGVPLFEIHFSALPSGAQLGHALGALSTAAQLCGAECLALSEEAVARMYLAMRACPSGVPVSPQTGGQKA